MKIKKFNLFDPKPSEPFIIRNKTDLMIVARI